eukprot:gene18753-19058_t
MGGGGGGDAVQPVVVGEPIMEKRQPGLGIPLAELCRRPGMPCPETWRNWCRFDYGLELAYADARAVGYGAIMEEAFREAVRGVVFPDRRIEAKLKLAAKWSPNANP